MKLFFKSFLRTKMYVPVALILALSLNLQSCDEDGNLVFPLTEAEVAQGLREALKVGTNNSVETTSQHNGYYGNSLIRIPWPEDAMGAYNFINNNLSYLKPLLDEVIVLMNRGAEDAADKAGPIFINAITSITIADAWNILNGANNAATEYLHQRTYESLFNAFRPDIHNSLEVVGAASAWTELTSSYNLVATITPGINTINTDLSAYTTGKALDGLFVLVAEEELKIRTDPAARINDILRRVFGTLD